MFWNQKIGLSFCRVVGFDFGIFFTTFGRSEFVARSALLIGLTSSAGCAKTFSQLKKNKVNANPAKRMLRLVSKTVGKVPDFKIDSIMLGSKTVFVSTIRGADSKTVPARSCKKIGRKNSRSRRSRGRHGVTFALVHSKKFSAKREDGAACDSRCTLRSGEKKIGSNSYSCDEQNRVTDQSGECYSAEGN